MKKVLLIALLSFSFSAISQDSTTSIKGSWVDPKVFFEEPKEPAKDTVSSSVLKSLEADKEFLNKLPATYDKMSPSDMRNLALEIENKLQQLIKEKEELIKSGASQEVIDEKDGSINSLKKEKNIVNLTVENGDLTVENEEYERWLLWAIVALAALLIVAVLGTISYLQRRKIIKQSIKIIEQSSDLDVKSGYLEYAARLIRHDMHSGINTYIPRGVGSLEKRITDDDIKRLKIDGALKMIKEGLTHTQKVYRSVYEFTNLVKKEAVFEKTPSNIKEILDNYLSNVSYKNQVTLTGPFPELNVNDMLFCSAIDNLIRNGLKYNDSENKEIFVYMDSDKYLVVQDNGRGMSAKDFVEMSKPYVRKEGQKETGDGLGLTISLAILQQHGFTVTCEELLQGGTKIKINTQS